MKTFGEYLRFERERRNISLEEVRARIRVSMKYLRAFEEDDLASYPQETYAKGFLRSYAQAVGLDENGVVRKYQYFLKRYREEQKLMRRRQLHTMGKRVLLVAAPVMILSFLVITFWMFSRETESMAVTVTPAVVATPALSNRSFHEIGTPSSQEIATFSVSEQCVRNNLLHRV